MALVAVIEVVRIKAPPADNSSTEINNTEMSAAPLSFLRRALARFAFGAFFIGAIP